MQDDEGHIVVLLGTRDERIGILEDPLKDGIGLESSAFFDGRNEPFFAPLFVGMVHGLADAVGESNQKVAAGEGG